MSNSRKATAVPAPHSWSIPDWPASVYPGRADRGRYLVRCNRSSLLQAGALVRIGRDLVVIGSNYSRWLDAHSSQVNGYQIAPNRTASQTATG